MIMDIINLLKQGWTFIRPDGCGLRGDPDSKKVYVLVDGKVVSTFGLNARGIVDAISEVIAQSKVRDAHTQVTQ